MRHEETPIILGVEGVQEGGIPQTSNTPRFLVLATRIEGGQLDVRISLSPVSEVAAELVKHSRASGSR
jgi:hypothetical protein